METPSPGPNESGAELAGEEEIEIVQVNQGELNFLSSVKLEISKKCHVLNLIVLLEIVRNCQILSEIVRKRLFLMIICH